MSRAHEDEFYVGYLPEAPPGIATRARVAVLMALAIAVAIAWVLVVHQSPFSPSTFEFGVDRSFAGLIRERPYPTLEVLRPGQAAGAPAFSSYLLVAFGKSGAAELVAGHDGQPVQLSGSLIYHDGQTMIEVHGALEPLAGDVAETLRRAAVSPERQDLGMQTLRGEIVDSKCFLGVMKPGNLKPHRSCATRCISGGIPPVLAVRGEDGVATYFLLVSEERHPVNREVLGLIAQPVSITGRVSRQGDLLVLAADPASYRLIE